MRKIKSQFKSLEKDIEEAYENEKKIFKTMYNEKKVNKEA